MSQNPYQAPGSAYSNIASMSDVDARASFIRKTYLHLLSAILACVAIDAVILTLFDAQLGPLVQMVTSGLVMVGVLGSVYGG